jgi:glycosyltransferase involved in cell wall biosynthesis
MYYDLNIFNQSEYLHFDSTFAATNKLSRLIQSVLHRFRFILLLLKTKPAGVFIYTSSYWGFYDKAFYALMCRLFGIQSALNLVGGEFFKFYRSNVFHRLMVRVFIKFPNKIIIGSSSWVHAFEKEFPSVSYEVIHNPVVWQSGFDLPKNRIDVVRFLFFGRLAHEKGVDEIIQAIILFQMKSDLKFHFTFAGKGPIGDYIKSALADMIKTGTVSVFENVSDANKNQLLQSSDVFVLPSHAEVLPISLLEAMGHQMPAIITDVGGMKDAVTDNVNGFVIKDLNHTVHELVRHMQYFINHPKQIDQMGKTAYQVIKEQFEFNVIFQKKINLFK